MKIHHLGIRGKCYIFIENLYLSFQGLMDNYQNHLLLRKVFVRVVPSRQFCLIFSLITFLINVINMESLLEISFVMEVSLQMTLCVPTRS